MAIPEVIRDLLENGVHFGHLSKHWNPKMKRFIFGKKKNIYIIDLEKTAQKLAEAKDFVKGIAEEGQKILFVATKRQLRDLIKNEAHLCGMPYVAERWVGGFLTNFSTIRARVTRYITLLERRKSGGFDKIPRKEVVRLNREIERMEKNYSGVTSLEDLPGCVFVVDPKKEVACVREANKLGIPIAALIDTDADPGAIDYPIPGNDDAIKSVRYITSCMSEAIREGLKRHGKTIEEEKEEVKEEESDGAKYEEMASPAVEKEEKEEKEVRKRRGQRKGETV
ncbi:MAG: 30S ribosomal protein S2 [Candidatus Omnitrophota bacterium]|nr:MAG: 30S ribosomal protein S2 [Candidatus Omnitrophota bacterium]